MRTGLVLVIVALTVTLTFADGQKSSAQPTAAAPAAATANSAEYVIGESDLLAINVWREQELSRVIPVRPDGKISFPLIGDLQASGFTPAQLQATLTERLRKFVENPEVTVIVQEPRSKQFNVVGEVLRPGTYPLGQKLTVLDAIALAGGFRDFAKVKKIYVLRVHNNAAAERLQFDYKRAIKGDVSQNLALEPRDTIVVP